MEQGYTPEQPYQVLILPYLVLPNAPLNAVFGLPTYFSSNGSLLSAIAMMAAGWEGNNEPLPGFPKDDTWKVSYEGLSKLP